MLPLDPTPQPDRATTHIGALTDALTTERRLLDDLARVLIAQRQGISTDDLETLDESVFAAHRIFLTLQEARQRRRTLLQLVGVDAELPLRELDAVLGPRMTPELGVSRDELLGAAAGLERELSTNRRVIDGAMSIGEQLLGIFVNKPAEAELYSPGEDDRKGGNAGAIVNTRV